MDCDPEELISKTETFCDMAVMIISNNVLEKIPNSKVYDRNAFLANIIDELSLFQIDFKIV